MISGTSAQKCGWRTVRFARSLAARTRIHQLTCALMYVCVIIIQTICCECGLGLYTKKEPIGVSRKQNEIELYRLSLRTCAKLSHHSWKLQRDWSRARHVSQSISPARIYCHPAAICGFNINTDCTALSVLVTWVSEQVSWFRHLLECMIEAAIAHVWSIVLRIRLRSRWFLENGMLLNPNKTEAVLFGTRDEAAKISHVCCDRRTP